MRCHSPSGTIHGGWSPRLTTPHRRSTSTWHGSLKIIFVRNSKALVNVFDHAYPAGAEAWFGVEARLCCGVLTVSVTDRGCWRPPRECPDSLRGRGLALIRGLPDAATVSPHTHGTTVTHGLVPPQQRHSLRRRNPTTRMRASRSPAIHTAMSAVDSGTTQRDYAARRRFVAREFLEARMTPPRRWGSAADGASARSVPGTKSGSRKRFRWIGSRRVDVWRSDSLTDG